jgi:hypothetical protein
MTSLTKLLLASAVVASFAAPALAIDYNSNNLPLEERNDGLFQQSTPAWHNSYAMDRRAHGAYAMDRGMNESPAVRSSTVDGSSTAGRGADAINGGF